MAVGVVLALALGSLFVWTLVDAPRNPRRWRWFYDEANIWRTRAWTVALTGAALLGAALGGASAAVLAVIAVVGLIAYGTLGRVSA
jgi:hypothetical protein